MFRSIIYGTPAEVDREREFSTVNWRMRSSFLPQDRVNEFAKLKPDELLRETQRVAGHRMLNEWHDLLKNMSAELKNLNGVRLLHSSPCSSPHAWWAETRRGRKGVPGRTGKERTSGEGRVTIPEEEEDRG